MSAVGYGAEVHYCLGQVSEVSYIWFDASCVCDEAGDEVKRKMNCCEDERFFVQLEDDHQHKTTTALITVQVAQERSLLSIQQPEADQATPVHFTDRAPPSTKERLIALHRLTFYA